MRLPLSLGSSFRSCVTSVRFKYEKSSGLEVHSHFVLVSGSALVLEVVLKNQDCPLFISMIKNIKLINQINSATRSLTFSYTLAMMSAALTAPFHSVFEAPRPTIIVLKPARSTWLISCLHPIVSGSSKHNEFCLLYSQFRHPCKTVSTSEYPTLKTLSPNEKRVTQDCHSL